jgi:hypothetical protein
MKARDVDDDGVVSDVRAARRAIAARFDFDLDRLFAFLREQEKARPAKTGSPRRTVGKGSR